METNTKKCPYCAEIIQAEAIKCKHCGEMLNGGYRQPPPQSSGPTYIVQQQPARKWSPGIAALLSFLIPGAGQLYKGKVVAGLLWFFVVIIGYVLLVLPGLILHLVCIGTAASGDPYKEY